MVKPAGADGGVPGSVIREVRAVIGGYTTVRGRMPRYPARRLALDLGEPLRTLESWETSAAPTRVRLQLIGLLYEKGKDPRTVPALFNGSSAVQ